jgi:hypothetical protein
MEEEEGLATRVVDFLVSKALAFLLVRPTWGIEDLAYLYLKPE